MKGRQTAVVIPTTVTSPPRRVTRHQPQVVDTTVEAEVMGCLARCAEAETIVDARNAIDELFDQYPTNDSSALCVLARELAVNLIGGNHNLVELKPSRPTGAGNEEDSEDAEEGEDSGDDDEVAFLEQKREQLRKAALKYTMKKSPSRSPKKSPSRISVKAQNLLPPPPPFFPETSTHTQSSPTPPLPAHRATNSNKPTIAVPRVHSEASGSDIPSSESESNNSESIDGASEDEPEDSDLEERARLGWQEVIRLESGEFASDLVSPSRLLSYDGGHSDAVTMARKSFSSAATSPSKQPQAPLDWIAQYGPHGGGIHASSQVDIAETGSDINDSIDSSSCDDYYQYYAGLPSGYGAADAGLDPAAPDGRDVMRTNSYPADSQGSLQFLRENIHVDNDMLDSLVRNVTKYSMRSQTERLFTKILGDSYMAAPKKRIDRSGIFRNTGADKQQREVLGVSPDTTRKNVVNKARDMPVWGRGQRFASPTALLKADNLNTSRVTAASAAAAASVLSRRYFLSSASTPTYKKASDAKSKPRGLPTRRLQPPVYKYPKPTPPTPPTTNLGLYKEETITSLAEKAGISLRGDRKGSAERRRTYINMRGSGASRSGSKKRQKQKAGAGAGAGSNEIPTIDAI